MKKLILLLIVIILFISCKAGNTENNKKIKAQGILTLVGSEPFAEMMLQTENDSYFLSEEFKNKYMIYIGKKVEVTATLILKTMETADKKHKKTFKYLQVLTIKIL